MARMVEIVCKCGCERIKNVRIADVNRGWGKFFSKSCKARYQSLKHVRGHDGFSDHDIDDTESAIEDGWDGYKNCAFL